MQAWTGIVGKVKVIPVWRCGEDGGVNNTSPYCFMFVELRTKAFTKRLVKSFGTLV
jgi:hypothetical protein